MITTGSVTPFANASKPLGPAQRKKFAKHSLERTLRGIGCKLVLVEDPEATAKNDGARRETEATASPTQTIAVSSHLESAGAS
jgi:hypothetical protein